MLDYANDNGLARFLDEAKRFPMLTEPQEQDLAKRWQNEGDEEALKQLIGSHLRLVIKMAMGNRGYGLPVGDLIGEGCTGIMRAADRFDPDRGFRFSTYAQWWIRAAIQEYILRSWSIVRLGTNAAQKKIFFNLRRLKGALDALEEGDLRPEVATQIATELQVPAQEVVEMNRRMTGSVGSLNAPAGEDTSTTFQDLLPDETDDQETVFAQAEEFQYRWALVEKALQQLKPRERHIVTERKLSEPPKTLADLSVVYGISRERVRQIEAVALKKIKEAIGQLANPDDPSQAALAPMAA